MGVQAGVVTRVWLDQRIDQRVVCLEDVSADSLGTSSLRSKSLMSKSDVTCHANEL